MALWQFQRGSRASEEFVIMKEKEVLLSSSRMKSCNCKPKEAGESQLAEACRVASRTAAIVRILEFLV